MKGEKLRERIMCKALRQKGALNMRGKEKRRGEERRETRSYRALQALMKDLVLK